jgi:hypothetical protein
LDLAAQAVIETFIFRLELKSRSFGLKLQQRAEIAMRVAIARPPTSMAQFRGASRPATWSRKIS